jgi:hypothetical protein
MTQLRPVTLDDIPNAPIILKVDRTLAVPRQRVYDLISGDPARWGDFAPVDHKGRWISETPDGVGSVREIGRGPGRLREQVLVRDDGKRWGFYVVSTPLPMVRAMAEDYLFEDAPGGCTLRWSAGIWPIGPVALVRPVATAALTRVVEGMGRNIEKLA